jgi:RNA polymerase sigma-70 factor (ECF subfamily)
MTQSDRRDEPESAVERRRVPGDIAEPDPATIQKARQGDLHAFESLYRGSVGRVNALCLRLSGGDRARAEDFVQEVYLRVWEKLGSFEGRAQFSSWVHRVALNRLTDLLRTEIRRSELAPMDSEAGPALAAGGRGPELRLDLEAGIRSLPAGARVVFVLHDVEGYGHEEIAAMTGLSAGTSKSQLHRARRLLRARLSQ